MKRYLWNGVEYEESLDGNMVFYEDIVSLLEKELDELKKHHESYPDYDDEIAIVAEILEKIKE